MSFRCIDCDRSCESLSCSGSDRCGSCDRCGITFHIHRDRPKKPDEEERLCVNCDERPVNKTDFGPMCNLCTECAMSWANAGRKKKREAKK